MRKILKSFFKKLIGLTKPIVWRLAEAYDLRVDRPLYAVGRYSVTFEDGLDARRNVPKTVVFNTGSGNIFVGAGTAFGHDAMIVTGKHFDIAESESTGLPHMHVPSGRDVRVGRGCFVGSRAILIGPLIVGDYAVIGAGAVVTHDVPPRTFVAGVPAKVVRVIAETEVPT